AVVLAGTEVVLAIRRGRVNDAGTGAGLHVLGQVDRREALVERVAEADIFQRAAFATGDDVALQAIALQAGLDQLFSQYQQLLAGVDQCIDEVRMDVERLVGRNGPRRGGPDDDAGRLHQVGLTKGSSQLVGVFHREGD